MKRNLLKIGLLIVFGFSIVVLNACKHPNPEPSETKQTNPSDTTGTTIPNDPNDPQDPDETDIGVKIGKIIWAKTNVDAAGTFAASPQDYGRYFSFISAAKNACPSGWRLPTKDEQLELLGETSGEWTDNYNGSGIAGKIFTNASGKLFFPTAGTHGYYWSSTVESTWKTYAYCLNFNSSYTGVDVPSGSSTMDLRSVRCVTETTEITEITLDKTSLALFVGEEYTLKANLLPQNAIVHINWTSSNDTKATVAYGKITGVAAGEAIITAKIGNKIATCAITVSNALSETSVTINGVKWATRNVDAPNTFTATSVDGGMYYQWNSKIGWVYGGEAANYRLVSTNSSDWDNKWSGNNAYTWEEVNNPCPTGWRVPTSTELQSLENAGSVGTIVNGVNGRKFGNNNNAIFLPEVGMGHEGYSYGGGYYWSSEGYNLGFNETVRIHPSAYRGADAYSVRCVAK